MNPDKVNSRIIIPISSYEEIIRGYPIDMFLYANNYEAEGDLIEFFSKKRRLFRYSRREEEKRREPHRKQELWILILQIRSDRYKLKKRQIF